MLAAVSYFVVQVQMGILSASWRDYDIVPHRTSVDFLTNCLNPWMRHTS